jgi:uncharacterized protein (TIGR00251 family)
VTVAAGRPASASAPWRRGAGCVIVRVRLTPKSSKDAVDGIEETVEARVRAVPADGAANAALLKLLAQWIGVGQASLRLAKGGKSRVKSVEITGNAEEIETRLAERLAGLA